MGRAKQLLDIDGQPMLSVMLRQMTNADVDGVVVVTTEEIAGRLGLRETACVFVEINDDSATDMIDSVRLGLKRWARERTLGPYDGFLVSPADQVGVGVREFDACIDAYRTNPDRIVIASHNDRRGHPIVFPCSLASFVQSRACDEGLRCLARNHESRVTVVPLDSPAILRNINTPDDYESLG